jgi:NAD-dependent dihydropyrimidine dehydrogenase PreA subunit
MRSGPFTVTTDCTACGACLRTCPERCLRPTTGCGECAEVCPAEAIRPLAEVHR